MLLPKNIKAMSAEKRQKQYRQAAVERPCFEVSIEQRSPGTPRSVLRLEGNARRLNARRDDVRPRKTERAANEARSLHPNPLGIGRGAVCAIGLL